MEPNVCERTEQNAGCLAAGSMALRVDARVTVCNCMQLYARLCYTETARGSTGMHVSR